jgi:hypothetical protein
VPPPKAPLVLDPITLLPVNLKPGLGWFTKSAPPEKEESEHEEDDFDD